MLSTALLVLATASCGPLTAPLPDDRPASFAALERRVFSRFGDGRTSFVRGHLHSGLDLAGQEGDVVKPVCRGTVIDVHLAFPHTTIVVQHVDVDGARWFSTYKHVADVSVVPGQEVDRSTRLARLFRADEQRRAGWARTHLHFEIRRHFDDGGSASWTSMDRASLERTFLDPLQVLRARMAR